VRLKRALAAAAATMTLISYAAAGVIADSSASAPGSDSLDEVVVTADKREENLQRAPLAVTALSQPQLQDAGVQGVRDLASVAPNVEIRQVGFGNDVQVTIRGITNSDFNESANPAVATYIDGVYVGRTEGLNGEFYDLQRVEVLRGPQGTLYGRNSTGGNVNIITADPKQSFGAAVDASYGNYADVETHAMLNMPVSDTLAVRVATFTHRNDGYFDTEGTTDRNYEQADDYGGRVTALWAPMENFKWRLSVDDYVSRGTPGLDVPTGPNGGTLDGLPVFKRPVSDVPEPNNYISNFMARSRMDWKLNDGLSLTYVAGFQHVLSTPQTVEGTEANLYRQEPSLTYSHEIDMTYDAGPLKNILGGTYFHQLYSQPGDADVFPANLLFTSHANVTDAARGFFDQATFSLSENLRLIGGVRYSSESIAVRNAYQVLCPLNLYPPITNPINRSLNISGPGCVTVPSAGVGLDHNSGDWSNVNWKAGAEYDLSEHTSTYFTVTTGFKSGGLNLGSGVAAGEFSFLPEKVTNYEFGAKNRFFDNRISLNAALFYEDYKDLQVTQLAVTGGQLGDVTQNAAQAKIKGVELEGQWLATANDRIGGFFNYLSARYTDYKNAVDQLTGDIVPDLSGNYLPHSPKFSARLQYTHDYMLTNGATLTPLAAVYWQTTSFLREFNLPIDRVPAYTKTNLSLTYQDATRHWKGAAYVDNLEDKDVRNSGVVFFGYLSDYNPPRTFGMRLTYEY